MRLGKLLFRSFSTIKPPVSSFFSSKPSTAKAALLGLGLSLSAWYTSTKIYPSEMTTLTTDDNLLDGEVRELLVGPKPEDTILVINYQG